MSFLHEIRKQPQHHREIMFGLCVVTTISLVGMVWYNSFQQNLYALLNPGQGVDQTNLAQQTEPSMFGGVAQVGQDLKAAFLSIFNLTGGSKDINIVNTKAEDSGRVYTLPLSEKK
jgi:hypothetical protein